MSEANPIDQAVGQAGQSAAVALQVLVLIAQAVREHQRREAVGDPPPPPRTLDPETQRYALAVREKISPPEVADALINGPGWNRLAEELRQLERAGVDVRGFLGDAAPLVARIDADLRAALPRPGLVVSPAALTPSNPFELPSPAERPTVVERLQRAVERVREWLQQWRERRNPSAPTDRAQRLAREGVGPQQNTRLVIAAREAIADERLLGQLVASRQWPAIAGQMQRLQDAGRNPREALAGVAQRMRQAADAGIQLNPAEAASGLLSDQAKAATPATTVSATAAATSTAAPAPAPAGTPTPTPRTPVAASSTSTPAPAREPVFGQPVHQQWSVRDARGVEIAAGTMTSPWHGQVGALEHEAAQALARATRGLTADDPARRNFEFSGGVQGQPITLKMRGDDARVLSPETGPWVYYTPASAAASAAQPSSPTSAAEATAGQREVGYVWTVTKDGPEGTRRIAGGEAIVPAGPGEREAVEKVAARELAQATQGMKPQAAAERSSVHFSGIRAGGSSSEAVRMQGSDAAVLNLGPAAGGAASARAASARSTTAPPAAAGRSPAAATAAPQPAKAVQSSTSRPSR